MTKIKNGDTVSVNYTGKLNDGSVFDSSMVEGREPLIATLGEGRLIRGFENGLIGMQVGESKTITLEPSEAYGDIREDLIVDVPRSSMPESVQVGEILQGQTNAGPINVRVLEISDDFVKIDGNHPLAGKQLIFELEVVNIQ
jgi:FKBP-type peptidyl-prolyl cis-trans isomerase 2